jgi:pimeloyl-ACP methyl ester carboxylesterase
MPTFERNGTSIYYEEYGSGYPVVLFAPGGMRSSIEFWSKSPFDPTKELASDFRVIAMDQRNAGKSRAPLSAKDGWESYSRDHIGLLDHLKISQCHLLGGCIGSSYCLGLIKSVPDRVSAAVLQKTRIAKCSERCSTGGPRRSGRLMLRSMRLACERSERGCTGATSSSMYRENLFGVCERRFSC